MIKSLFRQMWNQRHANVWVWVELIVVLILLWYSIDLVYNYEAAARQTKGYDTENVFDIQLNIKPALQNDSVLMSHSAEYLEQIYHLIQQYQGGGGSFVFIMGQYLIREIICMRDMLRIRIRPMW